MCFTYAEQKMKIKLFLLFIVMDFFTLFAYPIMYLHGKISRLSKPKRSAIQANFQRAIPVSSDR